MRISNLLSDKGTAVATIAGDATVAEAVAALSEYRIGALVVSDDGARIQGILSERDIVRRLHDHGEGLLTQRVDTLMSATVFTCSPEDDSESLMTAMTERRIRHVPVVSEGRLSGIVSIGDVVKSRLGELQKDRDELVDYINAR